MNEYFALVIVLVLFFALSYVLYGTYKETMSNTK